MFLAREGQGFSPRDEVAAGVDLATDSLLNGTDLPPQRALNVLLTGKFENPLLGLIGAHCLLREPEPRKELIHEVLDNLERPVARFRRRPRPAGPVGPAPRRPH